MSDTALALIEAARLKHWSFVETALGDGAAVRFLNHRFRSLLLRYREALRSLTNETVQTAAVVSGVLVGIDATGVPYFTSSVEDGYALHFEPDGTPYFDATDTPVSIDPFGAHGGTPGWPLPADAIALYTLAAVYQDGSTGKIDVVEEATRHQGPPGRNLAVFLSGNRFVPIRPSPSIALDAWTSVVSVQLNYLPVPTIAALADVVKLPAALIDVVLAGLAELFAMQSKDCPPSDRAQFTAAARRAEQELDTFALDVVGDLQVSSVLYEG
jgi:hypothetical protein